MNTKVGTSAHIEMTAVARPKAGICLNEAKDKWLAANPDNKILDYGDKHGRHLLVGYDNSRTVEYALVPELSPPGATLESMAAHMKAAGFDVRGINKERKTVIVCEQVLK